MFTCPEKDIHSIYIDGELPAEFKAKYEAHVNSCKKCSMELHKLQKLHQLFQSDSISLNFSEAAAEAGFKRLESRLSFRKVTSFAENSRDRHFFMSVSKFAVPAAAAAAVFAFVLPVRIAGLKDSNVSVSASASNEIQPIVAKASISAMPISENGIFVNGNLSQDSISNIAGHRTPVSSSPLNRSAAAAVSGSDLSGLAVHYLGKETNDSSSAAERRIKKMREALVAVDIFRPEFDDSQTVQINITIPSVGSIPVSAESFEQAAE